MYENDRTQLILVHIYRIEKFERRLSRTFSTACLLSDDEHTRHERINRMQAEKILRP